MNIVDALNDPKILLILLCIFSIAFIYILWYEWRPKKSDKDAIIVMPIDLFFQKKNKGKN